MMMLQSEEQAGIDSEGRATTLETSFERVVGRVATDAERARLYRLRDALGLRDNDAFWSIVMALEYYDSLFREYPEKVAEATERAAQRVRAPYSATAQEHLAAAASGELARRLAETPAGLHRVSAGIAAAVAYGSLCTFAGYELAAPGKPFWIRDSVHGSGVSHVLAAVLSLPAGWMVFTLLIPAALAGVRFGWRTASDPLANRPERIVGGCIVASCALAVGACAVLLARIV